MGEQRELSAVVGRQLRQLRGRAATIGDEPVDHLTQEDVARGMRACGFGWRRDAVAQVERGTRRVTLEELAGLTYVLHAYQVEGELIQPDAAVELAPGWTLRGRQLRALLAGDAADVEGPIRSPEAVEVDDAATRAAGRLGVHRVVVAEAAHALYGHPLGVERDVELAARGEEVPEDPAVRSRVAGGITRRLVEEELRAYLEGRQAGARTRAQARRAQREDHLSGPDGGAGREGAEQDGSEEGRG